MGHLKGHDTHGKKAHEGKEDYGMAWVVQALIRAIISIRYGLSFQFFFLSA